MISPPHRNVTRGLLAILSIGALIQTATAYGIVADCATVTCATNQHVVSNVCANCAATTYRHAGDDPAGTDTTCTSANTCDINQYATGTASDGCLDCAAGTYLAAGSIPGTASTCAALCKTNENVVSNVCTACDATKYRHAGDDPAGVNTACTSANTCDINQYATSTANDGCLDCAVDTYIAAGSTTGTASTCVVTCPVNHAVAAQVAGTGSLNVGCVACPTGKISSAGSNPLATCAANKYVSSKICTDCANGYDNAVGDYLNGADTTCTATLCAVNKYVSSNVCTTCPAGTTNALGDNASGADTTCDATKCAVNEYVKSKVCTACAAGTTNALGDDASGANTVCDATKCAVNEYVKSKVCTACTVGTTNTVGDDASGADTACDVDAAVKASSASRSDISFATIAMVIATLLACAIV